MPASGYAPVDGLDMYYEIQGAGDPLVFIPPAFGFAGMPSLPAQELGRAVITIDLQGNGRTSDIPGRPVSIEQYAKDVVALMSHLGIARADFLGESYGGNTAAWIALHHPELVRRVATYAATFGPPERALNPAMTHYVTPPTAQSHHMDFWRESYRKVAPHPDHWPAMFDKVGGIRWAGFSDEEMASIKAPMLILVGDHDFVLLEHAIDSFRRLPDAQLAVIPDASHFALFSEPEKVIPIIRRFLDEPSKRHPLATAEMGYHPGTTR